MRLAPKSVRVRLTLWYVGALAVVLLIFSGITYVVVRNELWAELDRLLERDFLEAAPHLVSSRVDAESVVWEKEEDLVLHIGVGAFVEAFDAKGRLVAVAEDEKSTGIGAPRADAVGAPYSSTSSQGIRLRVLDNALAVRGRLAQVRVARTEEPLFANLRAISRNLAVLLPIMLLLAGSFGYVLARRALRPVDVLTSEAHRITAEHLKARLPVANPDDELGRLADAFNKTFERLDRSFGQLRRFTADASHELRTPLTALRAAGEIGLRESKAPEQYREVVGSMLEEADRLARLVDTLLLLARSDAGTVPLRPEPFDLAVVVRGIVEQLSVLAEEKGQTIHVDAAETNVVADKSFVRQVLSNLIDNAIKYSPRKSVIAVAVRSENGHALCKVADQGPGIPTAHRARIFDRFHRVDDARARDTGGFGLGLAIARSLAELQGGRLELSCPDGGGSVFSLFLPLPAPDVRA